MERKSTVIDLGIGRYVLTRSGVIGQIISASAYGFGTDKCYWNVYDLIDQKEYTLESGDFVMTRRDLKELLNEIAARVRTCNLIRSRGFEEAEFMADNDYDTYCQETEYPIDYYEYFVVHNTFK